MHFKLYTFTSLQIFAQSFGLCIIKNHREDLDLLRMGDSLRTADITQLHKGLQGVVSTLRF